MGQAWLREPHMEWSGGTSSPQVRMCHHNQHSRNTNDAVVPWKNDLDGRIASPHAPSSQEPITVEMTKQISAELPIKWLASG